MFEEFRAAIEAEILLTEDLYARIRSVENRKEYALQALTSQFSGALFAVRDGKVNTIRESILSMSSDKLLEFLDKKI